MACRVMIMTKEKGYPFKTKTKVCKKFTSKIILTKKLWVSSMYSVRASGALYSLPQLLMSSAIGVLNARSINITQIE